MQQIGRLVTLQGISRHTSMLTTAEEVVFSLCCVLLILTLFVCNPIAQKVAEETELGLTFPDTMKLLEYLCIWIGATAAMVHMMPHAVGTAPNQNDRLRGQSITVGNDGEQEWYMYWNYCFK